jgi:hypothetical protein
MVGFLFGGDTNETPESIKRKRDIVRALMNGSAPRTVGEGIGALGDGIVSAVLNERANKAEGEGRKSADSDFSALSGMFGGDAPASIPNPGAAADLSSTNPSRPAATPIFANDGTELGSYLSDDARRATLPAGMRNNNPGNIKFVGQKVPGIVGPSVNTDQGDPQAVFDTPESGMKAMYSLLGKKYSGGKLTPNQMIAGNMGWTPGNYDAAKNVARTMGIGPDDDIGFSDPQRAAKFMQALILQEHGQKGRLYPESLISSAIGGRPAAPTQVASLDPAAGMPATPAAPQQQAALPPEQPADARPALPAPVEVATPPVPPNAMPPQNQVAQALRQPPQRSNAELQAAQKVLSNPFASDGQRSVAQALLRQELDRRNSEYEMQLKQNDPAYQLGLEKDRLTLEQMRNPRISPAEQRRLDLEQQKFDYERNKPRDPTKVGQGEALVGPDGKVIYKSDPKAVPPTVQKLKLSDGSEMAVQWNEESKNWDPINAPSGGADITPKAKLTESQSKLTLFKNLQTEAQPVLLDLEKQFNPANLADAAARSTPIAGNFFKSEQGQIYDAASTAWAEGALRIATGAAATPEEMERTKRAYFAQPGDTPTTIAFKAQMREMYNRSIEKALGSKEAKDSLPLPSEFLKDATGKKDDSVPPPPDGIDPEDWKFMTPAERKLFK